MTISITCKNIENPENAKSLVESKLQKLERMFDAPVTMDVVLSSENRVQAIEVKLTSKKIHINATAKEENTNNAVEALVKNLKKQIDKHKEKRKIDRTKMTDL